MCRLASKLCTSYTVHVPHIGPLNARCDSWSDEANVCVRQSCLCIPATNTYTHIRLTCAHTHAQFLMLLFHISIRICRHTVPSPRAVSNPTFCCHNYDWIHINFRQCNNEFVRYDFLYFIDFVRRKISETQHLLSVIDCSGSGNEGL